MARRLTDWRAKHEWLRIGIQCGQAQAVRKWHQSNQQAFKNPQRGFPKFKSSKSSLPSIEFSDDAFRFKQGNLCLSKGISIPIVWSRELPSTPKTCVISRDCEGHWNVSFVVRRDPEKFPVSGKTIGIDWGVKQIATTTDPDFNLACGNQIKINAQSLKQAQRKLSRAKRYSKGYFAAKLQVSRIHLAIARQRKDRAFKWARKVVANFGKIAVEDFKPKFLSKSTMAKKATDGAVGMTKTILINMATVSKRECVLVNPAYTSMTCASCGTRTTARLALHERTFVCEHCGHSADRDVNAAHVIRARAGFTPTNADDVRLLHDLGCAVAV